MEAHKGFIWLDSELNKGTTFYLAVPLMNDEEIYTHSLEQEMQKAKSDKRNIAIIKLKEKANTGNSVIDKILKEDIIRKTAVYKDFSKEENGIKYYDIYTADIDSFVYDFEKRRLETYIREAAKENPECGIMYSSALYPQDGETIKKINKKLEQFSKGDTDEENIIGG